MATSKHMSTPIGAVNHFANAPQHLSVQMVGRNYRVVWQRLVDGAITDVEPVDELIFDNHYDANAHRRALAKQGAR